MRTLTGVHAGAYRGCFRAVGSVLPELVASKSQVITQNNLNDIEYRHQMAFYNVLNRCGYSLILDLTF